MEEQVYLVGLSLLAILIGMFQYSKNLIKSNNKQQVACNREINKRDKRIVELDGQVHRLKGIARKYKASADKEADFNQRLLETLTLPLNSANILETKELETVNERKRHPRKPQQT